jgi:predicted secreted protein
MILCMALLMAPCSSAFVIQSRSSAVGSYRAQPQSFSATRRFISSSDNEAATPRKRRLKRKEAVPASEDEEEDVPVVTSRPNSPVELKVQDVRDLVQGGRSKPDAGAKDTAMLTSNQVAAMKSATPGTGTSSFSNNQLDDSLAALLQDAKRMQAEDEDIPEDEKQSAAFKANFRNVLSTIVTADFFVVCGFLLWFVAGIFCSYILKDDTVQIAFNSKYLT